tara:strand:- start:153 stop:572 length:420 start_codon:yes stop_codon:yes gene_type:complete
LYLPTCFASQTPVYGRSGPFLERSVRHDTWSTIRDALVEALCLEMLLPPLPSLAAHTTIDLQRGRSYGTSPDQEWDGVLSVPESARAANLPVKVWPGGLAGIPGMSDNLASLEARTLQKVGRLAEVVVDREQVVRVFQN